MKLQLAILQAPLVAVHVPIDTVVSSSVQLLPGPINYVAFHVMVTSAVTGAP